MGNEGVSSYQNENMVKSGFKSQEEEEKKVKVGFKTQYV